MRVDATGNVGVGTTSPSNMLEVIGNADVMAYLACFDGEIGTNHLTEDTPMTLDTHTTATHKQPKPSARYLRTKASCGKFIIICAVFATLHGCGKACQHVRTQQKHRFIRTD